MKRKILRWIPITVGAYLVVNAIVVLIVYASNLGLIPQAAFGWLLIGYGIFYDRIKKIKPKYIHAFVALVTAGVLIYSGALAVYGSVDKVEYDEDVVIVLGSGLRGEEVAPNLAKRLDKAAEYYEKNNDAYFVVTGGQGPFEQITEALAMERYLIEKGIPQEKIIKEDKSTSTYENFEFAFNILNEKQIPTDSVIFITNKFHIFRAEGIAKSLGIEVMKLGADTVWYTVPMNYMREMVAVLKYLLTVVI
ncbi:MAG: YdcF family protein [Ruminococcaceae bacterium]|nr:YdcF family protein [Oscillospiraceae bacterium]